MFRNDFFGPGGCFGYGFIGGGHILMMSLFLILVVALVIWGRKNYSFSSNDDALGILKENFAKGLITEEEYMSRKHILTKK